MDGTNPSISPAELYARLGTAAAPVVLDVRRNDVFSSDRHLIIGALHRTPDDVERWCAELPAGRPVIAYCGDGHEISPGVVGRLRSADIAAAYLDGGLAAWKQADRPTRKQLGALEDKWVTREHPKIDRIACPWLISRFINPLAEFIYVPAQDVVEVASATGATAYDIKGVTFGHAGDRCSFDAIIRMFEISDPALDLLADIVRGADTSRPDLTPQCEGLLAISYGLSANYPDDHEMLKHGVIIYDALYSWCRMQRPKH